MAKVYTQTNRILKSYNTYLNKLEDIQSAGKIAVTPAIDYERYKNIYQRMSESKQPNIGRTIIADYNVVTSQSEARQIKENIKEFIKAEYGDEYQEDDFYSTRELRSMSGQELWEYLKDLGMSDRQAGATYDGDDLP